MAAEKKSPTAGDSGAERAKNDKVINFSANPALGKASLAARLNAIFQSDRAQGHSPEMHPVGDKLKPDEIYDWVVEPTPGLWQQHLNGDLNLGLWPLRKDGMCQWGVLDVDRYGEDITTEIAYRIHQKHQIIPPVLPCRTSSGGNRTLLLLEEPVLAEQMVQALTNLADQLDLVLKTNGGDTEIITSNIWMPYRGGSQNICIKHTGAHMSVTEFVNVAERSLVSAANFKKLLELKPPPDDVDGTTYAKSKLAFYCDHLSVMEDNTGRNNYLNKALFCMGTMVGAEWIDEAAVIEALKAAASKAGMDMKKVQALIDRKNGPLARGKLKPPPLLRGGPIVSKVDHHARAALWRTNCRPNLRRWRGDFYDYNTGSYRAIHDDDIKAAVHNWLSGLRTTNDEGMVVPLNPNKNLVDETLASLGSISHIDTTKVPPCWLDGRDSGTDLIAFPNGILNHRTGMLLPSDPNLFTTASLRCDYEATAANAEAWLKFLNEIFDQDQEQIDLLHEVIGIMLTDDISFEKAFAFIGPIRSGKGTIKDMIRYILSEHTVAGPTLASLSTNFGLQPLIGCQLAIIDDLRIKKGKTDQDRLCENILKITGRGLHTIDRKFKSAWTGVLNTKLLLLSNEMPKFEDESSAVASRFIIIRTKQSFYGKEDRTLFEEKLKPERLGVLHLALQGLTNLRKRGHFKITEAGKQSQFMMARLGSKARAFLTECCVLDPEATTAKDVLYAAWKEWCEDNGNIPPGSKETFCSNLYAAAGDRVYASKPRSEGRQVPSVTGVRLSTADDEKPVQGEFVGVR